MQSMVEIGRKVLERLSIYFHDFAIISPWKKGGTLHLNKLDFPSAKDDFCQVWLKLTQWFWRRRFLNLSIYFHDFAIISPWKKGGALHLNKLDFPSAKDDFCQVWLKLTQFFFKFVNVFSQFFLLHPLGKVYDNNNDNDDGQRTNSYQKSLLEPSAQVSKNHDQEYFSFLPSLY